MNAIVWSLIDGVVQVMGIVSMLFISFAHSLASWRRDSVLLPPNQPKTFYVDMQLSIYNDMQQSTCSWISPTGHFCLVCFSISVFWNDARCRYLTTNFKGEDTFLTWEPNDNITIDQWFASITLKRPQLTNHCNHTSYLWVGLKGWEHVTWMRVASS
jgi:hypothetical protein